MKLAEKLVSLRKEKGLSQLQLAEMMDVSRQAISRWEVGSAVPSTDNLRFLSELYGVTIDYLINEESKHPVRVEAANGEKRKSRSRIVWVCCMLVLVIVVSIIIVVAVRRGPESVEFNEIESEDWNDVSTDEIPIVW